MSSESPLEGPDIPQEVFANSDERLIERAEEVIEKRRSSGLENLVGGLQCMIINTEPARHRDAVEELLRYTGLSFEAAFENQEIRAVVLKTECSADFMITSRKNGATSFTRFNDFSKSRRLPNTRLESYVFETTDIKSYVKIQKSLGVSFLTERIVEARDFLFIQTPPSMFTGNSIGFIQWRDRRGAYGAFKDSQPLDWRFEKPPHDYLGNIKYLDHSAARVRAEERDSAIIEFMSLTNYNFQFTIYVKSLNSITNVARLSAKDFAMVFTSGVSPYVSDEVSGPTEKFIHNYGTRTHHIAFHTEKIDETFEAIKQDGMEFLVELVGSPDEGLKQTFTVQSPHTMLVNEYIHRYGDFDGFFTSSNVEVLTKATEKQ